jgi:hypothetical protein
MPTKRQRIGRPRVPEMPGWYFERFLSFGEGPAEPEAEEDPLEWWVLGNLHTDAARAVARQVWAAHREEFLRRWCRTKPGTRPFGWWELEAPRIGSEDPRRHTPWERERCCDPRLRLGGLGVAMRDQFPAYLDPGAFGLPSDWIVDTLDPLDPPQFEAEAAYLERHGLLSLAERLRLTAADFQPVVLDLKPDACR